MMRPSYLAVLAVACVAAFSLATEAGMSVMSISSPSFRQNGAIPSKFTCDGNDVNPALLIEGVPAEAKSLALIVDDPDASRGTWVHWVVWNIGPATRELAENSIPSGGKQGMNDFRKRDYGGPCPPSGTHRYFFKLYALDAKPELGPNTTKAQLEKAMEGRILNRAELVGTYSRR